MLEFEIDMLVIFSYKYLAPKSDLFNCNFSKNC